MSGDGSDKILMQSIGCLLAIVAISLVLVVAVVKAVAS